MRALLVEDEALVAMIVEEALTALGFDPVCVFNGADALKAYAEARPDVVVIDVGLPDMRGDELARRFRAADAELPIVLASGYDPTEVMSGFMGDRRTTCLAKPYTEEDLAEAVRAIGLSVPA